MLKLMIPRAGKRALSQLLVKRCGSRFAPVIGTRPLSTSNLIGNEDEHEIRKALLESSLLHLSEHGWSREAVAAGAIDHSLSPLAHGILRDPESDLVYYWMDKGTEKMKSYISQHANNHLGIDMGDDQQVAQLQKERLVEIIKLRLEHSIPVIRTWHQAMATGAYPSNASETLGRLDLIADLATRYATGGIPQGGFLTCDESSLQWVSQRAAVLSIYSAAELYMLTDYSENFEDTWQFVKNRVTDLEQLNAASNTAVDMTGAIGKGLLSIATGFFSVLNPTGGSEMLNAPTAAVRQVAQQVRSTSLQVARQSGNVNVVQAVDSLDRVVLQSPIGSLVNAAETTTSTSSHAEPEYNDALGSATSVSAVPTGQTFEPVQLPNGLSVFGLASLDVQEASRIVQESNPSFQVIAWPAEKPYVPMSSASVVRLLHDDGVVVDVSRS